MCLRPNCYPRVIFERIVGVRCSPVSDLIPGDSTCSYLTSIRPENSLSFLEEPLFLRTIRMCSLCLGFFDMLAPRVRESITLHSTLDVSLKA